MRGIPSSIGRYPVVSELGRGGFATVYLGEDRGLDDLVAIKMLSESLSYDPEHVSRFVAEARVMRNLKAPGIVTVHDVGDHEGQPYFVMEYCKLGALSERLSQLDRVLTIDEAIGLAQAISRALSGLHSVTPPVIHRDIKPENLLIRDRPGHNRTAVGPVLGPGEELIVGDFGLAKVADLDSTKLSIVAYTKGFAPPEQIRGESAVQPSTDVYSASAVLVAAISGESPQQVFASDDRAFPTNALAATGPLRTELERGMAFDRHQRHTTIMEWAQALGSVVQTSSPVANQPRSDTPPTPVQAPFEQSSTFAPTNGPSNQTLSPSPAQPPYQSIDATTPAFGLAAGKRSRFRTVAILAGVLAMVAVAIAAFVLRPIQSRIIGPSESTVGDTIAFAVVDGEVTEWQVAGQTSTDPILGLRPSSAQEIEIKASVDGNEETHTVAVKTAGSELRIVGPAHWQLGEIYELTTEGSDDSDLTWTLEDGAESNGKVLGGLKPTETGVFEVTVRTASGLTSSRTFTVAP